MLNIKKNPPQALIINDKYQDQPFQGFVGPF